ncbi:hypothetical protein F5Y19DRAFT_483397 [Xylariaceae sp. FL1651]|nr:hypothetical protein F5Y19DRAFT_483397 [Xylariaceae sp. FL1651]
MATNHNPDLRSGNDENTPSPVADQTTAEAAISCAVQETTRLCCVCMDEFGSSTMIKLPCRDEYCRGSFTEFFRKALKYQRLPICCGGTIAFLEQYQTFFSKDLILGVREVEVEQATIDRTYCYWPRCGKFIPPTHHIEDGVAHCPYAAERLASRAKTPPIVEIVRWTLSERKS